LQLFARDIFDVIVGLEIFEIAMAISLRDSCAVKGTLGAVIRGAIARDGPNHFWFTGRRAGPGGFCGAEPLRIFRCSRGNSPAAALANGTIWSSHV
jgi:hypothetical protein